MSTLLQQSTSVHSLPCISLMPSSAAPRSPSSSVCSYAGSVNSDFVQANKYLMKTLCLAKKSAGLPGKADYANLLTSGLGARKWVASLDLDAESFKGAIMNIYPRLSSVPSYSLCNMKPDRSFENLPCTVNTPKRIKAYLGSSFTGSLIIMPSEEISLGPVKVPVMTGNGNHKFSSSTASVRSARSVSSSRIEKECNSSGYESYQESNHGGSSHKQESSNYYTPLQASSNSSSHKMSHTNSAAGSNGSRSHRQICLTCGRLAKQAGSTSFYDIHNSTTFSTSDGYVSIAKKLRGLFQLELPRSKLVTSDQICRKCFQALNEIHLMETQLKRNKEEMMSTLFATVTKISKLEQIAQQQAALYSPQPVFLAPLARFTHSAAVTGNSGRHRSQSPAVDERSQAMFPINLVSTRTADSNHSQRSPLVSSAPAMFMSNSPHYAQSSIRDDPRDERRSKKHIEREAIEEQMAAEEEAEDKEVAERDHGVHAAYLEEGHCSDSSSMGNNSSPDSQSPSPPMTSSNGGSDSNNISNEECSYESKKYSSPNHESLTERRSYWKKRYHDHTEDGEEYGQDKKIARMSVKSPERP